MSTQDQQPSPETEAALDESRAMAPMPLHPSQLTVPALQRLLKEALGDAITNVTPRRIKWYERH